MTLTLFLLTINVRQAGKGPSKGRQLWLLLASALAFCFLGFKALEYSSKITQGLLPSTSMFLALFYTLTAFHAVHVLGGLVANLWVARGVGKLDESITLGRIKALALYWTFVDVVWIAILAAFYAT